MDVITELAGAYLACALEGKLLLQLAERPTKLDLVGLPRTLADQPPDVFWYSRIAVPIMSPSASGVAA
jgi:hypothetical protein